MATALKEKLESGQSSDLQKKVNELRELYADAPELGRVALERAWGR